MMKRLQLSAMATLVALVATAQTSDLPKAFSFTVVPDGETPATISGITTDAADAYMQIDWGDGVLTAPVLIEDYATTWPPTAYSAVPKGETVTVYADPATVNYIDGSWGTGTLKWTSVDVSALTELKKLEVQSNSLKAIDVTANTALTTLNASCNDIVGVQDLSNNTELTNVNFSNTESLGTNNVDGSDFSALTKVTTLNVSNQKLTSLKVAGMSALGTLNITNCHLPEIDLTGCTALKTLNANFNDFETIDISPCETAKSYFYLNNNKLSSIKTAEAYTGKGRLQITNNCFTFATLPAVGLFETYTYTYSPQAKIVIKAEEASVDLTEYMPVIGENATVASWTNGETSLVEGTDYTVDGTVYTFLVSVPEAKVALTNAAFPSLTLESNVLNIVSTGIVNICNEANVGTIYNINGQQVQAETLRPGIYIMVKDNKAQKVYIK